MRRYFYSMSSLLPNNLIVTQILMSVKLVLVTVQTFALTQKVAMCVDVPLAMS